MTTVVYVGPTLPPAEVARLLPGATVRPPVAVGDVLALLRRRGVARIAIIDGYFERMAAVWHKELLLALERGITVYGAASMGALRAAELARFGMIGTGAIYRAFARGELVADDEVAVAHLPAEQGYRAVSEALVNIRFALARAPVAAARYVELARARFYRERTWARLVADARAAGVPTHKLEAWLRTPPPDQKATDARGLLARLARDGRLPRRTIRVPRTWALRQLIAIR
jgi:hypothetical protein